MPTSNTQSASHRRNVWIDDNSFTTTLLILFTDVFGTQGLGWSPETIKLEVEEAFNVQVTEKNFNKLMVGVNLVTSDDFYKSLPDFIMFCNVLSGDTYEPEMWDPADTLEIAWGILEGILIDTPDRNEDNPFTQEIVHYIEAVMEAEGIITPPDILKFAGKNVDPAEFSAGVFAEDPLLFNAAHDLNTEKTSEINRVVFEQVKRLIQQLEALPLDSGNTKGTVEKLLQGLKRSGDTII